MGRKVTAREVAAEAGVSSATVDRVLNGRGGVTEIKERAVFAAARRLGLDRALNQRAARTLRIAVLIQSPTNAFHAVVAREFEAATRGYAQFNMQFRIQHIDPAAPDKTAQRIAELAPSHDALVLMAPQDPSITEALSVFYGTGKPVIALATDLGAGGHRYIGPDNRRAGRMAGDLMGRFLGPEGGGVLVIAGMLSMRGQEERVDGFCAVLAERYPTVSVARVLESQEKADRAGDLAYRALRGRPDIRGIYNASAGAQSIVDALGALGRQGEVAFITHELTDERRRLLHGGLIDAILDQDPAREVRVAVESLAAYFGRAETAPASLITPMQIHMIENC